MGRLADPSKPGTAAHVRAWAREQGRTDGQGSRGLLPADLVNAYDAAHPDTPYTPDRSRKAERVAAV